jgi:hypothetical protein
MIKNKMKNEKKRESRISSSRSFVNGRVISNPDFERRVIVLKRVSSSAVESICCDLRDLEREVRVESREVRAI